MRSLYVFALTAVAMAFAAVQPAAEPRQQPPEQFEAIAANISNVGAAGLVPLTIRVTRWTSDEDHRRLFEILRKDGQEAFLDELVSQKPVGWVATPTSLRYDFFYAREDWKERGWRRIMMISDRPMQFSERVSASPSRDYPFTVVEMHLDEDDRGRGTLAQLVQLRLLGDVLGVDNLASAPIRLNDIKKVK